MGNFDKVLAKCIAGASNTVEQGTAFEELMRNYFHYHPKYKAKEVWLWGEFPHKIDISGKDIGIDLVMEKQNGDFAAIQCKCFDEGTTIDKKQVDTFVSTAAREFEVEGQDQKTTFSERYWVSTSDKLTKEAEGTLRGQENPIIRLGSADLRQEKVDWEKVLLGKKDIITSSEVRDYQSKAIEKVLEHFQDHDRGKLIMACGTGKTFTSLKIAQAQTNGEGRVLVLVPSISLISQTLESWTTEEIAVSHICVCSDSLAAKKTKKEIEADVPSGNINFPNATTNKKTLVEGLLKIWEKDGLKVVFSTYHSIKVVKEAQQELLAAGLNEEFDLIICDEAHRTTGAFEQDTETSHFVKVHDGGFIRGKKRLYMTATPRLYSANVKVEAEEKDITVYSMDDVQKYGTEIYRYGFRQAVDDEWLSDYKVLIFALNKSQLPTYMQAAEKATIAAIEAQAAIKKQATKSAQPKILEDDSHKLGGCFDAFSYRGEEDERGKPTRAYNPMKRVVVFGQTIAHSKGLQKFFTEASNEYAKDPSEPRLVKVDINHVDGNMRASDRSKELNWLQNEKGAEDTCRVLSNVRCLGEGIDVPALDAVAFLAAKQSEIGIVQAVGRVMRKAKGKDTGFIILPVVIADDEDVNEAMLKEKNYKVIWQVVRALQAHDERFSVEISNLALHNGKSEHMVVIGGTQDDAEGVSVSVSEQQQLNFRGLLIAKIAHLGKGVDFMGWGSRTLPIVAKQTDLLNAAKAANPAPFAAFLESLQAVINPTITEEQAIEMLVQHNITQPVFEALFYQKELIDQNPISQAIEKVLEQCGTAELKATTDPLKGFYGSVRTHAREKRKANGDMQELITDLYQKFFQTAFPKMSGKLGIAYTPIELVDFTLRSVDFALRKHFDNSSLSSKEVRVLDPFTGMGTFMARLIASELITQDVLLAKYQNHLFANDILPIAYYIAEVNIETALAKRLSKNLVPFKGLSLTDTFHLREGKQLGAQTGFLQKMVESINAQNLSSIQVIIGNPPYSVAKKVAYPLLKKRIKRTYGKGSDSYVNAFRWATDRLDKDKGGIIAYVSNGSWLDSIGCEGVRKCFEKEFSDIYVLNLRGNQRTSGEISRKEGGKIFGSQSRVPVTITLLIKRPNHQGNAHIHYYAVADCLTRDKKLDLIKELGSMAKIDWQTIEPNAEGDWINHRDSSFSKLLPLRIERRVQLYASNDESFFVVGSCGVKTNRDPWCYNFSNPYLERNIKELLNLYNIDRESLRTADDYTLPESKIGKAKGITFEEGEVIWPTDLKKKLEKNTPLDDFEQGAITHAMYRPFCPQWLYYDKTLNQSVYQQPKFFPIGRPDLANLIICVQGKGGTKAFSVLITEKVPNNHFVGECICYPLYYYAEDDNGNLARRDGITNYALQEARSRYGNTSITKEAIFYYVYGYLHSPQYRTTFANSLRKVLPRVGWVDGYADFQAISDIGKALAELHLNYDQQPPHPDVRLQETQLTLRAEKMRYAVLKMKFPTYEPARTQIVFNNDYTLTHIPLRAYDYQVNGQSAIEWVMENYTKDFGKERSKGTGITQNPNEWQPENPRYVLDLLQSIIHLSTQTQDLIDKLPSTSST